MSLSTGNTRLYECNSLYFRCPSKGPLDLCRSLFVRSLPHTQIRVQCTCVHVCVCVRVWYGRVRMYACVHVCRQPLLPGRSVRVLNLKGRTTRESGPDGTRFRKTHLLPIRTLFGGLEGTVSSRKSETRRRRN